jgi:hypothetical protein
MKKLVSLAMILMLTWYIANVTFAQGPPPPPSYDEQDLGHGSTMNQEPAQGGTAPIGSGILLLLTLGASYGFLKFRTIKRQRV